MTNLEAADLLDNLIGMVSDNHDSDYDEALSKGRDILKSEPCEDAVSRQAVADKLLRLCNELEGIFANIRMQNQDESVCGLCEYDCPAPYECPGFDIENCFKLAAEIRHEWQSTKDLPPVTPQPKTGRWITVNKGLKVTSYKCSECGRTVGDDTGYDVTKDYPYCHCGAKMEAEE